MHRLAPDEEAYELRLQYEGCRDDSGSTHPEKAAVTVSVERRGNCSSNLVPWMCELSAQDVTADSLERTSKSYPVPKFHRPETDALMPREAVHGKSSPFWCHFHVISFWVRGQILSEHNSD